MRKVLIPLLILPALIAAGKPGVSKLFDRKMPKERKILHALNRLTFGPRPGDVEAVQKIGLKNWMEQQLNPGRIEENPELLAKLKPLDTLQMTTQAMVEHYPTQQMLNAMARGVARPAMLPKDPELLARAERVAAVYKRRINAAGMKPEPPKKLTEVLDPAQIRTLRSGTTDEKARLLNELPENKLAEVVLALPN